MGEQKRTHFGGGGLNLWLVTIEEILEFGEEGFFGGVSSCEILLRWGVLLSPNFAVWCAQRCVSVVGLPTRHVTVPWMST